MAERARQIDLLSGFDDVFRAYIDQKENGPENIRSRAIILIIYKCVI